MVEKIFDSLIVFEGFLCDELCTNILTNMLLDSLPLGEFLVLQA